MELSVATGLVLVSFLYLSLLTNPASAKCTGRWSVHACYGGNGKRSDPNFSPESRFPPSLLHKILLSDAQRLSRILQDSSLVDEDELLSQNPTEDEPVREDGYLQENSRKADVGAYLRALKLQHALRDNDMDLI